MGRKRSSIGDLYFWWVGQLRCRTGRDDCRTRGRQIFFLLFSFLDGWRSKLTLIWAWPWLIQLSPRKRFKGLFRWMNRATGDGSPRCICWKWGPSAGEGGQEVTCTLCCCYLEEKNKTKALIKTKYLNKATIIWSFNFKWKSKLKRNLIYQSRRCPKKGNPKIKLY